MEYQCYFVIMRRLAQECVFMYKACYTSRCSKDLSSHSGYVNDINYAKRLEKKGQGLGRFWYRKTLKVFSGTKTYPDMHVRVSIMEVKEDAYKNNYHIRVPPFFSKLLA